MRYHCKKRLKRAGGGQSFEINDEEEVVIETPEDIDSFLSIPDNKRH
jgi:hypothetical protein